MSAGLSEVPFGPGAARRDPLSLIGPIRRFVERTRGAGIADAAIVYLLLCHNENGTWPPTADFRSVTTDADPVSLSMTFYASQAMLDVGLIVAHSPFADGILHGMTSRKDQASARYGARIIVGDHHTFLQKPKIEVRSNLRHTAAALLSRHMLGDSKLTDFFESFERLVQDLNEVDSEADIVGIAFSIELLARLHSDATSSRRSYDQLARRLLKNLMSPGRRNAQGLWNPHSFLGHGSIEDSALLLFSMRHAVIKYLEKFESIIGLIRDSRIDGGWPHQSAPSSDLPASQARGISVRASIWAFASMARLSRPSSEEWSWYIGFLNQHLKLNADKRAPLSVAEMSCVLSTLALGGYVSPFSMDSMSTLSGRFRSVPGSKREHIADVAFATGWKQLRWLARIPILSFALLKLDIGLLNRIALEWSPMLTFVGFILAVISLVVGIAALR